jgi:hypothetical protein
LAFPAPPAFPERSPFFPRLSSNRLRSQRRNVDLAPNQLSRSERERERVDDEECAWSSQGHHRQSSAAPLAGLLCVCGDQQRLPGLYLAPGGTTVPAVPTTVSPRSSSPRRFRLDFCAGMTKDEIRLASVSLGHGCARFSSCGGYCPLRG